MPTEDRTAMTRSNERPARNRRPRDRKAQIVAAAADLFHQHGYHTVTMDQIAGAVGITAGALYRHFRNKRELLARTVDDGLSAFESAVRDTAPGDIETLLDVMASLTLDRRDLGVLWQRESRNLPDDERSRLRHRFRSVAEGTAPVVQAARPGLTAADADLLTWALFAVFASPSHHSAQLPRTRFHVLLQQLGNAVVHTSLPDAQERNDRPGTESSAGLSRASRRESVLDAAARLFGEHGYQAVSMEDIGAAAGISGAGIYNHVTAKSELLVAALTRAADALHMDAGRILATASTPGQALTRLLRSYIDLTLTSSHLTGALITEVVHLPDDQRRTIRRLQRDYVSEWVQLLTTERPDLTETEARVITQAVLAIINDLARIGYLRRRPHLNDDLAALGHAVLAARLPSNPS